MRPTTHNGARTTEIARIVETDITSLQQHLKEVIDGAAFRGSHRSGQFLKYIVEQAIAGHFDSLKERFIGVELFGRSPSYDTGEEGRMPHCFRAADRACRLVTSSPLL
jgi:hypothetical protein